MSDESFLEKIFYKKKYSGTVEKDGKVYLKYSKKKRFKFPHANTIIILVVTIVLVALYFLVSYFITSGKEFFD